MPAKAGIPAPESPGPRNIEPDAPLAVATSRQSTCHAIKLASARNTLVMPLKNRQLAATNAVSQRSRPHGITKSLREPVSIQYDRYGKSADTESDKATYAHRANVCAIMVAARKAFSRGYSKNLVFMGSIV